MRTTVDIDDGVVMEVKKIARSRHTSLRSIVNEALRLIVTGADMGRKPERYSAPAYSMGRCMPAGFNPDKALSVASALEDAEVAREMDLRR
jgi:hypothetical protein